MRKTIAIALTVLNFAAVMPSFAQEGSEKMCAMMGKGKGKGMMMYKGKMLSMMKEMQEVMMKMIAMMKECEGMKDEPAMLEKMDELTERCKEMMEETEAMMSECMMMKEGMMSEE